MLLRSIWVIFSLDSFLEFMRVNRKLKPHHNREFKLTRTPTRELRSS